MRAFAVMQCSRGRKIKIKIKTKKLKKINQGSTTFNFWCKYILEQDKASKWGKQFLVYVLVCKFGPLICGCVDPVLLMVNPLNGEN